MTEMRAPNTRSVFHFDVQGSVAKSTHAGIPWLRYLRRELGQAIHFWPFDGWTPGNGSHVVAEIYPSLWRSLYPAEGRTKDQQDAYAVCRWLQETDRADSLTKYFNPLLTPDEQAVASIEGWILGVGPIV